MSYEGGRKKKRRFLDYLFGKVKYFIYLCNMTRKKKPLPLLEGVTIEAVAAEGKALVRVNDLVVFVPFAVPGDVVDLQLTKKKHLQAWFRQ